MSTPQDVRTDPASGAVSTGEQRTMAALAHALVIAGYVVPFGKILAPLLIMVMDKSETSFVKDHARESLNAQLSWMVVLLVLGVASIFLIGIPFLCSFMVFELVVVVRATLAALDGKPYQYPLIIRLLK